MKPFVMLLSERTFLFFLAKSPKEEARKPRRKNGTTRIFSTHFGGGSGSRCIVYEANIRQYSEEGTFNAFAQDLPCFAKKWVSKFFG